MSKPIKHTLVSKGAKKQKMFGVKVTIQPKDTLEVEWLFGNIKTWKYSTEAEFNFEAKAGDKVVVFRGTAKEVLKQIQKYQDEVIKQWSHT